MARNKLPRTENDPVMAFSLDEIYDGTVAQMFDSLNENFETIGAQGAIGADSLASNAVTTDKIEDSAVTTNKINNDAIITAKISDGNITASKLNLSSLSNSTDFKDMLVNLVYPIGSYYWSSNNTSPQSFLGGIWTPVKDRFVLAAGDRFKADYYPVISDQKYPIRTSPFIVGNDIYIDTLTMQKESDRNRYIGGIQTDFIIDGTNYYRMSVQWYYDSQPPYSQQYIYIQGQTGTYENPGSWINIPLKTDITFYMSDGTAYIITQAMTVPEQRINVSTALKGVGGAEKHILSDNELPNTSIIYDGGNTPILSGLQGDAEEFGIYPSSGWTTNYGRSNTFKIGGSTQSHNNMPPYETAYCWKRTE